MAGSAEAAAPAAAGPGPGAGPAAPAFVLPLSVRDYELDAQGIVNNANYLHYFEHARHEFLRSRGVDFVAMHVEGLDAVVYKVQVEYADSLRSGDRFTVSVRVRAEGRLRLVFEQEARKEGGALSARARVETAIVRGGRPIPAPAELAARLLG